MSRYNKLARPAALSRQTTHELFFPHAANRLRSDINEVLLSYDEDNKVAIMAVPSREQGQPSRSRPDVYAVAVDSAGNAHFQWLLRISRGLLEANRGGQVKQKKRADARLMGGAPYCGDLAVSQGLHRWNPSTGAALQEIFAQFYTK